MEFSNMNVVVTGAVGAIGKGVARDFCRKGAQVFITDLKADGVAGAVAELKADGVCFGAAADVTNEEQVAACIAEAKKAFGSDRIDILVNVAGIVGQGLVEDITVEQWDKMFAVNCRGTFLFCKYCVPSMKKHKYGKIVNYSSKSGKTGSALMSHYSAAKAAIMGFSQALAFELADYRINVNCVCPGITDNTGVWSHVSAGYIENMKLPREEVIAKFTAKIPLKRLTSIDDVVAITSFLCGKGSDYMTGQSINITGGREMH